MHLSTTAEPLKFTNVLLVSQLKYILVSVHQLCKDNNHEVGFDSSYMHVKDKIAAPNFLRATSKSGIYTFTPLKFIPVFVAVCAFGDV